MCGRSERVGGRRDKEEWLYKPGVEDAASKEPIADSLDGRYGGWVKMRPTEEAQAEMS